MRPQLIIWRDVPIDVDVRTYEYIAKCWGNIVKCYYFNDYPEERKKIGIRQCEGITYKLVADTDVESIIKSNTEAIHVLGGFRGHMEPVIRLLRKYKLYNNVVICERPTTSTSAFKNMLHKVYVSFYYRYVALKYGKLIKAFLAMGVIGAEIYRKVGWRENVLYPYMYCSGDAGIESIDECEDIIRFVYIGRFDKKNKGVGILINAINSLSPDLSLCVEFIGGYGDLLNNVKQLSVDNNYVKYNGPCNPDEVVSVMHKYDVCIVPSIYDGWNLNINHAINANVGVITTSEATSNELVESALNGIVIEANDSNALVEAIMGVVKDRSKLKTWKMNSKKMQKKISREAVGSYFINIMDYAVIQSVDEKPIAPWLRAKE